jgi:hypothetical protein
MWPYFSHSRKMNTVSWCHESLCFLFLPCTFCRKIFLFTSLSVSCLWSSFSWKETLLSRASLDWKDKSNERDWRHRSCPLSVER